MKKRVQIMWLIAMVVVLAFPFPMYNLLKERIDTANHENRELAAKPELDLLNLSDYPEAFDDWLNDNLPFRNQLVAVDSLISIFAFNESPSQNVILGKDGWLFYNSNDINDFQGTNLYDEKELEEMKINLISLQESLNDRGIEFIVFIAPNKEQIYAEYMPDEYGMLTEYTRAEQVYDYLKDDIRIVYASEALFEAKAEYPEYHFYFHLDTHWNNLGAYVGAKLLLEELGRELPEINELSVEENKEDIGLDLSAMMNLTGFLNNDINYTISGYNEQDAEILEYDFGTLYKYSNSGTDGRKVLVIRDSFGEALAPILAVEFDDIMFCTGYANYDFSLIDKTQPDIVIYEKVERSLDALRTFNFSE